MLAHRHPHAQASVQVVVEDPRLARREVARVRVAERAHEALQRFLLELRLRDRAVELVLDLLDDLRAQGGLLVDERIAQRPGQSIGMPAEPDTGDQRKNYDEEGAHATRLATTVKQRE